MPQPRVLTSNSISDGATRRPDASATPRGTVNERRRSVVRPFTALVAIAALFAAAPALAQGKPTPPKTQPAPAKPAAPAAPAKAAPAKKADPAAKADKGQSIEEKSLRGVVAIERAGQPVGMGAVLAADGRVLTALSPLGAGNDLEVKYADGTSARVRLGHHDRVWDLALLVPQTGKWADGLTASSRDPVREDATLRSFTASKGKPVAAAMSLRSHKTLIGGDDKALDNALELGSRVAPSDLGSPIIDEEGRVVAIIGRGCAPNADGKPCTPVAFGAPTTAIRNFLRSVPTTAVAPSAWLGIQGVAETGAVAKGVRITVVHPESPADEAQLKGGDKASSDVILAVGGTPVTSPETLADAIRTHAVGEKVPLMVFGQGRYRQVTVLLRVAPEARAAGEKSEKSAPSAHPAELPPLEAPAPKK
ncbi:MAG: PDZ domain-containing protein [Polyangiaceae bacterium]